MEQSMLLFTIASLSLTGAAVAAVVHLVRPARGLRLLVGITAGIGLLANIALLGWALKVQGPVETFRHGHDATILLATLVALVGAGTYVSSRLRGLDAFLFLAAALVHATAWFMAPEPRTVPTYRSWFISHGLAFAVSSACFLAGGMAAVAYLIVHRRLRRKRDLSLAERIPSLEALENFTRWMLALGFPLFTYGILTGLCGVAHRADISQWAWYLDPSVILSALAWLIYGFLCFSLLFRTQVRGRRAAGLAAGGMVLVVVVFVVFELLSPIHR